MTTIFNELTTIFSENNIYIIKKILKEFAEYCDFFSPKVFAKVENGHL
jgi:hypothetical protein